jgi:phosphatidylglycerophosphate synthase
VRTPLHTRLVGAGALGCLTVAGAGIVARSWLPAGALYPWKAAALFAAMTAIALAFAGEHPFSRLGPANRVTIIRAMLVALTAGLTGEPETPRVAATAVAMAATAALLDGIDGWLARRSMMASAFGARADMETDALLIMALSVLVWRHDKAGAWVLACGLMRYAFVAAGWLLPWLAGPLAPTRRGQTVAVAQVVGLCIALLPTLPPPISANAAAATLAALTWSFAIDVRRLWQQR